VLQANLVKQLAKLVKVRYVEDITDSERVGMLLCGFQGGWRRCDRWGRMRYVEDITDSERVGMQFL